MIRHSDTYPKVLRELSASCVVLAPAMPLRLALFDALHWTPSSKACSGPLLLVPPQRFAESLRNAMAAPREQRQRELRSQLAALVAPHPSADIEAAMRCLQDREPPRGLLRLGAPATALFAQLAYWTYSPEGQQGVTFAGSRSPASIDACLQWPAGTTLSLVEPLRGTCLCPSCGQETAAFRTRTCKPSHASSSYELLCSACGHRETAASHTDTEADKPFLTCPCECCRRSQAAVQETARAHCAALLDNAAQAANLRFASWQRSGGKAWRGPFSVPPRGLLDQFRRSLVEDGSLGAAVSACRSWLARGANGCGHQPDNTTVVGLLALAGALRTSAVSGTVTAGDVERAWRDAHAACPEVPSRARVEEMLRADASSAVRAMELRGLGQWDQALLPAATGMQCMLDGSLQPLLGERERLRAAPLTRRDASPEDMAALETFTSGAKSLAAWLRPSTEPTQLAATASAVRQGAFWFATVRLGGTREPSSARLNFRVAVAGAPGASAIAPHMAPPLLAGWPGLSALPEHERTQAAELLWRAAPLDSAGDCLLDEARWQQAALWALGHERLYLLGDDGHMARLRPGPSLAPRCEWQAGKDAWRLETVLPPQVDLAGGCGYVDRANATVGQLAAGWTVALVSRARSLPPLPVSSVPALLVRWHDSPLAGLVPAPPAPRVFIEEPVLQGAVVGVLAAAADDAPLVDVDFQYVQEPSGTDVRCEDGALIVRKQASSLEAKVRDQLRLACHEAWARAPALNALADPATRRVLALQQLLHERQVDGVPLRVQTGMPQRRLLNDAKPELLVDLTPDGNTVGVGIEVDGAFHPLDQVLRQLAGDARFLEKVRSGGYATDEEWLVPLSTGYVGVPLERLATIVQHVWEISAGTPDAKPRRGTLAQLSLAELARTQGMRALGNAAMHQSLLELLAPKPDCLDLLPPAMREHLREAQAVAVPWMHALARAGLGGLLADEMSVGKTLTALVFLWIEHQHFAQGKPSLVVAPKGAEDEWRREMAKHGVHLSTVTLYSGDIAAQLAGRPQIAFCTYEGLRRRAEEYAQVEWHAVVTDESHELRNRIAKATLAMLKLRAACRFALGGTPWNNSTMDLWPQYEFAVPGLLGDPKWFGKEIAEPMDGRGSQWHCDKLKRRIAPFTLRRTRKQLGLDDSAERSVEVIKCVPCQRQRDLIGSVMASAREEVSDVIATYGFKQSRTRILGIITRVRQAISHPKLLGIASAADVPSVKFNVCKELIARHEAQGDQLVVCSPFTSVLKLIGNDSTADGRHVASITGEQSNQQRADARDALDSGDLSLLLLSMKAGGKVLNLQHANVYVQFDGWWNPFAEAQARARVDRTGRRSSMKLYELVVPDSIDDRMGKIKARKLAIADAIFGDAPIRPVRLTEEDVWDLLAPMTTKPA